MAKGPQSPLTLASTVPQSSSLCLWGIALILCVAESVFAVRCSQLTHQLLELKPWWGRSRHYAVSPPMVVLTPRHSG